MFKDWDALSPDLQEAAKIAIERDLIHGYPDGTLRVNEVVTREQLIYAVAKLAKQSEETDDADRRDFLLRIANAVVEVRSSVGLGSGVMLSGGRILTNAHVVGDDSEVLVRWTSPLATDAMPEFYGAKYPVIKKDVAYDLAMIHAPALADVTGDVEFAEEWANPNFGEVAKRFFGVTLYTQGSPVALAGALSRGYFSGIHFYGDLYLTYSGSINPGNSGGGIYDTAGRLVSLAVAKPDNAMVDGIGFGVLPLKIKAFLAE